MPKLKKQLAWKDIVFVWNLVYLCKAYLRKCTLCESVSFAFMHLHREFQLMRSNAGVASGWECDALMPRRQGGGIFDSQRVKWWFLSRYGCGEVPPDGVGGASSGRGYARRFCRRFFCFSISSLRIWRAARMAVLAMWMAKNNSSVSLRELRAEYLHVDVGIEHFHQPIIRCCQIRLQEHQCYLPFGRKHRLLALRMLFGQMRTQSPGQLLNRKTAANATKLAYFKTFTIFLQNIKLCERNYWWYVRNLL